MSNLSAERRRKMIAYLEILKTKNPDDADLQAINEIELALTEKRYGLVWEEHSEQVDEELRTKIPVFTQIDSNTIESANDKGCNFLLEGDNLHSLYLLEKTHNQKIDAIYIDPPYNSGAKDWKYNNDYVDGNDAYRHSKWLSMMKARLSLARKLLNPYKSVLIVTIDEREYANLRLLLDELFPTARIQMVSSVINPSGVSRGKEFYRTDEYIFFVKIGESAPIAQKLSDDWITAKSTGKDKLRWRPIRRQGSHDLRSDAYNQFYPIYVSLDKKRILGSGKSLLPNEKISDYPARTDCITVWPLKPDGTEGCWQISQATLQELLKKGYAKISDSNKWGITLKYIAKGEQKKVESGQFPIIGRNVDGDGSIITDDPQDEAPFIPGTQWRIPTHSARENGTGILNEILGTKKFDFPKSLYAVKDALRFFVSDNPNAVIVDFFAGSGTTGQAVLELNEEDGGQRRFILCTNNENNICSEVTYPRLKTVITGVREDGSRYSNGLEANLLYFRTGFVDRFPIEESLNDELLQHTPEMIELQNMTLLGNHCIAILDEDEIEEAIKCAMNGAKVYVANSVFLTAEQIDSFGRKQCTLESIPDYYFNFELKEVGE